MFDEDVDFKMQGLMNPRMNRYKAACLVKGATLENMNEQGLMNFILCETDLGVIKLKLWKSGVDVTTLSLKFLL